MTHAQAYLTALRELLDAEQAHTAGLISDKEFDQA